MSIDRVPPVDGAGETLFAYVVGQPHYADPSTGLGFRWEGDSRDALSDLEGQVCTSPHVAPKPCRIPGIYESPAFGGDT